MRFCIVICIYFLFGSLSFCRGGTFEYDTSLAKTFDNIVKPIDVGGLGASGGYFGIITGEMENRTFHLYDNSGEAIFEVQSDPEFPLDIVRMHQSNGVILLLGIFGESRYQFTAYNYAGERIMGPIIESSDMEASPTGKYYYTKNEYIFGAALPSIYDSQGDKIARLKPRGGFWELSAINDSMILFQDGNRLNVLSVPELTVVKKIEFNKGSPPFASMETAVSSDGSHYALLENSSIIICDLLKEQFFFVDHNTIGNPSALSLSPDGSYFLICSRKSVDKTVSLYHKNGDGYVAIALDYIVPLEIPVLSILGNPEYFENFCIINYSYGRRGSSASRSMIFMLQDTADPFLDYLVASGFSIFNRASKNTFIEVYDIESEDDAVAGYKVIRFHYE